MRCLSKKAMQSLKVKRSNSMLGAWTSQEWWQGSEEVAAVAEGEGVAPEKGLVR